MGEYMLSNAIDNHNPNVSEKWDVRSVGTIPETFPWVFGPRGRHSHRIKPGDRFVVWSFDAQAFTHAGVFRQAPCASSRYGPLTYIGTVTTFRLKRAIPGAAVRRLRDWRTLSGSPRAPFSAANTFEVPVQLNRPDRWSTIWSRMNPTDQQKLDAL